MIKRITALMIIAIISISISGCANKQEKQETLAAKAKQVAQIKQKAAAEKQAAKDASTTNQSAPVGNESTQVQQNPETAKTANSTEAKNEAVVKESFYGEWIIKKNIASGPVTAYGTDDIKNLIGKKLNFSEKQASFENNISKKPAYEKSTIAKNDFLVGNRINLSKLNINADSIKQVIVNGLDGTGHMFYIKDENTLILFDGGVYFELGRIN